MVSWIGAALVGGLLGMILTLVVLYGINGALDLSNSSAFVELDGKVSNLELEVESMQGKIDGLETRLDTLKGLTARVTQAEADVSELSQETATLRELADGLDSRLGDVSDRVTAVEERSDRVTTFFGRLTALLQELFGAEAEIEPAPESPVETPTPTE